MKRRSKLNWSLTMMVIIMFNKSYFKESFIEIIRNIYINNEKSKTINVKRKIKLVGVVWVNTFQISFLKRNPTNYFLKHRHVFLQITSINHHYFPIICECKAGQVNKSPLVRQHVLKYDNGFLLEWRKRQYANGATKQPIIDIVIVNKSTDRFPNGLWIF